MKTSYLLLWLEAPLQAWGADSKFGRRDSLLFPTKSGVTGLLLCALGASGEQHELLAELAPLKQTVLSFVRQKENVKCDREPLLMDFHMVGSGYNDNDQWAAMHIPKTAEGKKAVGGGTKLTYRYYLQDARFAVVMEVPAERADEFTSALQAPVFDIYLGRKNCAPTDFIFRGAFEDKTKAVETGIEIAKKKGLVEEFRVVDGEQEGDAFTLNDVPVQFGPVKKYRDRLVTVTQNG